MSRAKVLTSILMVLILIALSGVSVWAAPGGQEPAVEPPDEGPPTVHPVASALVGFFNELLGLPEDDPTIMDYHEDGWGFGVIAQACWMSVALEGNATLLSDILAAKKSGDFSSIEIDGETPRNWGQFKKAVMGSDKAKKNLGAIMSGRAKREQEQTATKANQGQGKGKKDKGTGEEDSGPPGKGKDKDKGGGPPAEPPGKGKDKDKDGGPPAEPPGKGKDKGGGKGKGK